MFSTSNSYCFTISPIEFISILNMKLARKEAIREFNYCRFQLQPQQNAIADTIENARRHFKIVTFGF